ncbi:MAG: hypothetical protein ACYCW6_27565 [Candidatus Xenobia bacterium]
MQSLQNLIRLLTRRDGADNETVGESTLHLLYTRLKASLPLTPAAAPPPQVQPTPEPAAPRLHPIQDVARVLPLPRTSIESVLRLARNSRFWPRQDAIGDDTLSLLYSTLAPCTLVGDGGAPAAPPARGPRLRWRTPRVSCSARRTCCLASSS